MIGKNNRLYTGPDAEWERRVRESMEAGKEWAFKVPSHAYDDIIHLPHHVSSVHPPMSLHDRAAQFSPFAALSGFEGEIRETERLTEGKIELDEEEAGRLDERLRQIRQHLSVCPRVSLTWFLPDERKNGGSYERAAGRVKSWIRSRGFLSSRTEGRSRWSKLSGLKKRRGYLIFKNSVRCSRTDIP